MGYVLHSSIYSLENLPPFRASIKDGYAIKYDNSEFEFQKRNIYNVVQVSVAGTIPNDQKEISEGECVRISTGAPIPPGANCIIQVEDTIVVSKSQDETIEMTIDIKKQPKLFDNIRDVGSDISEGELLLNKDTEIGPFEIALLNSVSCKEVCVKKHPTINIIPFQSKSAYRTSNMILNMIKKDGYKGGVFVGSYCSMLYDIPQEYENVFEHGSIIIICCGNNSNLDLSSIFNIKSNIIIKSPTTLYDDQIFSLEFSTLDFNHKEMVLFNTNSFDPDSIYNCMHLFILPILRFIIGRKQHISSVHAKCEMFNNLSLNKFVKSKFYYENGYFKINNFTSNHPNCITTLVSSATHKIQELDIVITENSDSYFINY